MGHETRNSRSMVGFSDHRLASPHAFHELDGLNHVPAYSVGAGLRGSRRAFALCRPGTPFCEANGGRPRPGRQPSPSLDVAARLASRRHLHTSPRCLDLASTTDVRVTSTRRSTTFGDPFRPPWENPPALELGTLRTRRFRRAFGKTPDHLAVIQPPTVARLTARHRLWIARQPRLRLRAIAGWEPPQLYRLADSLPRRASDTHRAC
jgi:hypothetical protein